MAISVNYAIEVVRTFETYANPTAAWDITNLANGGFAAVGLTFATEYPSLKKLPAYSIGLLSPSGVPVSGINGGTTIVDNEAPSTSASIDQLSNGTIVVTTSSTGGRAFFTRHELHRSGEYIFNPFADTFVGGQQSEITDVAALINGNFVSVNILTGTLTRFSFTIFSHDGVDLYTETIEPFAFESVVVGLDDGGFAVAYKSNASGRLGIYTAVYEANGSVRRAPYLVDDRGTINQKIDITATDDGYAIVYEDNERSANTDVALVRFSANGTAFDYAQLTGPATLDETPQIARMPDGLLAITAGYSAVGPADSDIFVALYDPVTQRFLTQRAVVTAGEPATDDTDRPTLAANASGNIAVFFTNVTDRDTDGELLRVIRTATGDSANDTIDGGSYHDNINGGGGNDSLSGFANDDTLAGGTGNDTLLGGQGADTLNGGTGKDLFTGGGGLDRFIFSALGDTGTAFAARDVINTFAHGDKIDLTAIDANTRVANDQAFSFIGAAAFSGVAGQLRHDMTNISGTGVKAYTVYGDTNGDRVADFSLQIYTSPTADRTGQPQTWNLASWDFIL